MRHLSCELSEACHVRPRLVRRLPHGGDLVGPDRGRGERPGWPRTDRDHGRLSLLEDVHVVEVSLAGMWKPSRTRTQQAPLATGNQQPTTSN